VISGFLARPDWGDAFKNTVVPSFQLKQEYVIAYIATIGTTITPWGQAFIQSYVADKGLRAEDLPASRVDVFAGALLTNVIAGFIVSKQVFPGDPNSPPEREILNLGVKPIFRRLGIARLAPRPPAVLAGQISEVARADSLTAQPNTDFPKPMTTPVVLVRFQQITTICRKNGRRRISTVGTALTFWGQ